MDPAPIRLADSLAQPGLVQRLDRVPAQLEEAGDDSDVAGGKQLADRLGQPIGDPLVAPQPTELLQTRAATLDAPDASARHRQHDAKRHQRQIPNPAHRGLVDLPAPAATVRAVHHPGRWLEMDRDCPALALGPLDPLDPVAFPAPELLDGLAVEHRHTPEPLETRPQA